MTFARLRKVFIISFMLVLIGAIPVFAMAASPYYEAYADPAVVKNFGDKVTVNIKVTNDTGAQMGPITLLDPAKNPVSAFGSNGSVTLKNGESVKVSDVHSVNEKEAGAGNIVYYLAYNDILKDDDGTEHVVSVEKPVYVPVAFDGTVVQLTAEREIAVGAARKGDPFFIVYNLTNTGTVDIKDIKVTETATRKVETYGGPLKPGEQKKISFMVSMGGSDMVSSAEITFRANDQAQKVTVGEQVIRLGEANSTLSVSCDDKDVIIGGTATLKITFENKGTISYNNVTISDKKRGVLLEGESVEAGETKDFYATVTLEGPTDFEISAVMDDDTGKTGLTLNAAKLTVNAYDPDKSINLTLNLKADQTSSAVFPFETLFTLTVTNTSNVTAKNITIFQGNASNTVTLATIPELKAGKNIVIPRMVQVTDPGKYQWSASCKDELGNKVTFESEVIQFSTGTIATPVPTATPRVSPTQLPPTEVIINEKKAQLRAQYEDQYKEEIKESEESDTKRNITEVFRNIVGPILLVLTVVVLVLLLIAIIMRIIHAAKHASAYDHMDLIAQRDFKAEAREKDEKADVSEEEAPHDFRKNSDYEPAVDMNDDSLTIGASVESNGAGSYMVTRGTAGEPAEEMSAQTVETEAAQPQEDAGTDNPAAAETEVTEAADSPLSKMKKRHAVKVKDHSEEE